MLIRSCIFLLFPFLVSGQSYFLPNSNFTSYNCNNDGYLKQTDTIFSSVAYPRIFREDLSDSKKEFFGGYSLGLGFYSSYTDKLFMNASYDKLGGVPWCM